MAPNDSGSDAKRVVSSWEISTDEMKNIERCETGGGEITYEDATYDTTPPNYLKSKRRPVLQK